MPLSKIYHAAFDAHLLGADADYRVHVSRRLLTQRDGPMLEVLKSMHGNKLHLPVVRKTSQIESGWQCGLMYSEDMSNAAERGVG